MADVAFDIDLIAANVDGCRSLNCHTERIDLIEGTDSRVADQIVADSHAV